MAITFEEVIRRVSCLYESPSEAEEIISENDDYLTRVIAPKSLDIWVVNQEAAHLNRVKSGDPHKLSFLRYDFESMLEKYEQNKKYNIRSGLF